MSVGAIVAIAVGVGVALVLALMAAQRAGDSGTALDGRELEGPSLSDARGRRRPPTGARLIALIAIALAAFGAGFAAFLSTGAHH